jgi:hypothetical protein
MLRRGDQRGQLLRIVREVRVHLTDHVDWFLYALGDAVDVRAAESAWPQAVHDVDAARMRARERVADIPRSIRRLVVDDEHANVRMPHQRFDEQRQVVPLVVRRNDHERAGRARRGHSRRPSKRSVEICSETRPTSKMTTLNRISSTDEFVTCDCVRIVHTA